MTDREKLIELLESAESAIYWNSEDEGFLHKIANHLLANGVTIQTWIPVTDRLPDRMGMYICNVKSFAFPGTFYQKEVLFEHGGWHGLNDVTHWMPLPEPPKE